MNEPINIAIQHKYHYDVVSLDGPVTFENCAEVKQYVEENASAEISTLVLELSSVPFFDSSALSLIIELMDIFAKKKINVCLMNPTERVKGLFQKAEISKYLKFIDSEESLSNKNKQQELDDILNEPD